MKKIRRPSETLMKRLRAQACFTRDGHKCLKCGTTGGLSPSHIYPQGRYSKMKWEIDNVKTLCWACHLHFWHGNPLEAREWLHRTLPAERLDKIKKMSQDNNLPKPDLNKIKIIYEEIIKNGNTF